MPVLKQISPDAVPILPNAKPLKQVPSCKSNVAGDFLFNGIIV
jgi:hypothetical protein